MGLCLYGFITPSLVGSLCFGAGLGITLFGISYMFVHGAQRHTPVLARPVLARGDDSFACGPAPIRHRRRR
jgi:beta-carotene 3-hydroxylase